MTPQELERHVEHARSAIEPNWDDARASRLEAALPGKARARRRTQLTVAAAVLAVLVAVGAWVFAPVPQADVAIEPVAAAGATELPSVEGRAFEVTHGAVKFAVKPGRKQPVRVVAGDVEVRVTGTRFLVERSNERVHVAVEEGSVQVRWRGVTSVLRAGADGYFPPLPPPPPPAPVEPLPAVIEAPAPVVEAPPAPVEHEPPTRPAKKLHAAPATKPAPTFEPLPEWKRLASLGDFTRAWEAMKEAPPPRDEAAELLLAADVARLSGHAEAAVPPLEQVVKRHAGDARAPLAAFTLGRVLLDDLGQPREAATAFETARTMSPDSRLAEDALARQVEAASRAQDASARALAEQFLERYPQSPRARSVRHFGGLER